MNRTSGMWEDIRWSNIHAFGVLKKEVDREKIFGKIIAEDVPKLVKGRNLQILHKWDKLKEN